MTTQNLGRFGRLQQTLFDKTKRENKQILSTDTANISCNTKVSIHLSETSEPNKKEFLVLEWMKICLEEGHIEPSQPIVGRLYGWPLRPFFCNSLFTDFECWCAKNGISSNKKPEREEFYFIADSIFVRKGDKYHFPPLEECRQKFKSQHSVDMNSLNINRFHKHHSLRE